MFFTIFTLATLKELPFKLSLGSGEQAKQASATVALKQQGLVAALVARLKCGLRCHCYNVTQKRGLVKGFSKKVIHMPGSPAGRKVKDFYSINHQPANAP